MDFYGLDVVAQVQALTSLAHQSVQAWPIREYELALIKYRENAVFKLSTAQGQHFALRIHRYGYHSDQALRSELQWIVALAEAGMEVPRVVPCSTGQLFTRVQVDEVPESRQVDLFAWVEGEHLGFTGSGSQGTEPVHDTFHTIGSLAAQLHNQSCGWQEPAGFSRHAWDEQGLVGENPLWGRFWELAALTDEQRHLLITIRAQVAHDLARYAADESNASQYSLIHADFVAENLLVDGEKVRLIDFDDAGYGWHLFELATALYFEMEESHYSDAHAGLIAGYRCHRQLSEQQLSYLPLFLMARGLTYLGWVHTRPETQTAKDMTPMLIGKACQLAREYLKSTGKDRTDNALVF